MSSFEEFINKALAREVPFRHELAPAWEDVLRRAQRQSSLSSVKRHGPRHRTFRRALAVLVAAAALTAGGLATAQAAGLITIFGGTEPSTIEVASTMLVGTTGQVSTCSLIGDQASQVSAALASIGVGIEWRFQDWGTVTGVPGDGTPAGDQQSAAANARVAELAASGSDAQAVASVPGDSIVWNALPDDQTDNQAVIFVEAPNDRHAPSVSVTGCS